MNLKLALTRLNKAVWVIRSPRLLNVLLFHRVLAGVEHRRIFDRYFRTVVDVGANRGQFALAVRNWAPTTRIISFEPLADPASVFRRIFERDPMVTFYQAAVGKEIGTATIHVAAEDDSSSFLPISDLQEYLFPGTRQTRTERVKIGRLSNFVSPDEISSPALLKLDVQGFELEALRGCEELLTLFSNIYVECSFLELYSGQALAYEVIEWLAIRKFHLIGIYNLYTDKKGRAIQADFLFSKEEQIEKKDL